MFSQFHVAFIGNRYQSTLHLRDEGFGLLGGEAVRPKEIPHMVSTHVL